MFKKVNGTVNTSRSCTIWHGLWWETININSRYKTMLGKRNRYQGEHEEGDVLGEDLREIQFLALRLYF